MYEVELKAWLDDKPKIKNQLHKIAKYDGFYQKADTYYHLAEKHITVRIRSEKITKPDQSKATEQNLVTYKKKETRLTENGKTYEVNLEKEFSISSKEEFESILLDSGYSISLTKTKGAESFYFTVLEPQSKKNVVCHIELCNVPPLGEFIEIETLTDDNSEKNVQVLQNALIQVLAVLNIDQNKIEPRYYKEMLLSVCKNY